MSTPSSSPTDRLIISSVLFCILALGGAAYGLRMAEMPASIQTKVTDPVPRFLMLKLPLQQEMFHWTFLKKNDFLAGRLVLNITRAAKKQEIVIFEDGKFAEGWGASVMAENQKADAHPKKGEIYFQFESQKKYDTAPGDEVELHLTVKKDLDGIGPMNTGVLAAGEYRSKGRYSGLIDEYQVPEQMRNMSKETVDKVRQVYSNKAFLENWQEQWPLRIVSEQGWLLPEERECFQNALKQMEKTDEEQAQGAAASESHGDGHVRAMCQNNLKELGLVLKMFADEQKGQFFPELSPQPGNLFFSNEKGEDKKNVYPAHLADLHVVVCPATVDSTSPSNQSALQDPKLLSDASYFYLGYVVTSDSDVKAFAEVYKERIKKGLRFDQDLDAPPGRGSWQQNKFYRLREGIVRFAITDINDPGSVAKMFSKIPILIERPGHHKPDGANILFIDGHVEFSTYPGAWPMTEETIGVLTELSEFKAVPAE